MRWKRKPQLIGSMKPWKDREIEGDKKHGLIHPESDPRCFRREMIEECLDGLNYSEWAFEKGQITAQKRAMIDRQLRSAIGLIACQLVNLQEPEGEG